MICGKDTPKWTDFLFSWSNSGFSYLEITIMPNIQVLRINIHTALKDIRHVNNWTDLPISWKGRIKLIKR